MVDPRGLEPWEAGSIPAALTNLMRGGAVVARQSHKLEVEGAIPSPASNKCTLAQS